MSIDTKLRELFRVGDRAEAFEQVSITVASPDIIRSWSKGEVKIPETINYRTLKPEKGGLFCDRIFGPTSDWECACGKFKRIKHKGVVCDRCGVEVTLSRVRRERMGHIELAVPVSHIWFYKCMPSHIGLMLDMSVRQLERVIYYEDYVVTEPGNTALERGQMLTESEMREAEDTYGKRSFKAAMGAEAIQELLRQIDLVELAAQLEEELGTTRSKQNKKKLSQRLKIAQGFAASKSRPEWMVLTALPVIPPDLRPLIRLVGGRFATADVNELYRRVINRNNRLKSLLLLKTPEAIIRNEKRTLQEAVDALLDNGRHGRTVTGPGDRPLKSLSDALKGKEGRFRQNLLGKRVDYSGRSVIVIGPDLKLNECGLPKKMALTLFEPFIIRRLKELGYCHTVRSAKKIIDRKIPVLWDILAEVTKGHPVLLNRAPTLHRLSIQAFEPKMIEGEAIRLHPLVCTAFNADFDGDEMAVHVPLSVEAQMECRQLMFAPNNIFSPASGRPITVPSQDIILGTYYLTWAPVRALRSCEKGDRLPLLENSDEVDCAIAEGKIGYHTWIHFRNPDHGKDSVFGYKGEEISGNGLETISPREAALRKGRIIETTPGRVRFNEIWPQTLGFINRTIDKKQIGEIIRKCYQTAGKKSTIEALDRLKVLGFEEATRSGISIGIVDIVVPEEKSEIISKAYEEAEKVSSQYRDGGITDGERYQKVVDIWTGASDTIANALYRKIEHNDGKDKASPLFMMMDSGSRGNKSQIKQLGGMRGLMAKPSGEIIERPILSNFREGLSVPEYFISTHGARKGMSDTALRAADSGYMTRKLVDVAQDVIITEQDCGTANGITVSAIMAGDEEIASLASRIFGRVSCEQIKDPISGEIIVPIDDVITENQAVDVERIGVQAMRIRSVFTCESDRGCCANCYGLDLATGKPVNIGEAVGIIAAQSVAEPATQLVLNQRVVGGSASNSFKQPVITVKSTGRLVYKNLRTVRAADGTWVALNKSGLISIRDKAGLELESYNIVIGSVIQVRDGDDVTKGDKLVEWDPYNVPILTERGGKVEFRDMIPGVTVATEIDKETGTKGMVVTEHKEDLRPQIVILDENTKEVKASYSIPVGAHLSVKEGELVTGGMRLARMPRRLSGKKDITHGLPRIIELFEARKPKDSCVIAKIDGEVCFGVDVFGKRRVIVIHPETGAQVDHLVPEGRRIIVTDGDYVKRGDEITEGPVSPEDLLEACGVRKLQEHLVNEVKLVYRIHGVEINDKHVEVIIRQMLRKVRITDPGDADEFLWGDQVERKIFEKNNAVTVSKGGRPAEAEPVLLGITKASLESNSFISAASFQDTTRVLTRAATLGKIDYLRGFKENVIMGHLIPAGTGFADHREVEFEFTVEEPEPDITGEDQKTDLATVLRMLGRDATRQQGTTRISREIPTDSADSRWGEVLDTEIGKRIGEYPRFSDLQILPQDDRGRIDHLRQTILQVQTSNPVFSQKLKLVAVREGAY